ncbi:MAG: hypothetical protein V4491_08470 [Pseudomonadota bacterium]
MPDEQDFSDDGKAVSVKDDTYNGWKNYETWAVGMYLDGNYDGPSTYYETVERVRLDTTDFQFLFADGDMLTFMDKQTYEQISLPKDLLGDAAAFLQDGMDVVMELYDERPISVQLPDTIEAMIVEADAVVKGQTASSSYKPAILDNGIRVMVPPHIGAGTKIVVDVYEQTYVKRAD